MEYNTKYDIGDIVWTMHQDKVIECKICYIKFNKFYSSIYYENKFAENYMVVYNSEVFLKNVGELFVSKDELLSSL